MLSSLYPWFSGKFKSLRKVFPPDGPRYELVDTSFAIGWIAFFAYVVLPPPPATVNALGAPLQIVTEKQLGVGLVFCMLVSIVLAYVPVRVFERKGNVHIVYPVKIGYQIARTAVFFMFLNFALTAVLIIADLYAPTGTPLVHSNPPIPPSTSESTLRAALVYTMVYGYAFRRLKRDNRVDR